MNERQRKKFDSQFGPEPIPTAPLHPLNVSWRDKLTAYSAACQDEADAAQGLVRALESALKTSEFERHPHRGWQDEARAALAAFKSNV